MDPGPNSGLRDSHDGHHTIQDPHSHHQSRLLSRLDDHDPSSPSASYPSANHHVTSSSPSPSPNANAEVLAHHAAATLEPDDFYKSYGALSHNGDPESLPMASSSSSVPQQALRPNGESSAARHLQLPSNRSPGRQNFRSISTPVDTRSAATSSRSTKTAAPSVRDLKRHFDRNNNANSIPGHTVRQEGTPARSRQDDSKLRSPSSSAAAYTSARSGIPTLASSKGSSPSGSSTSDRSQRSNYVAQDQVSSSSRSFASRIGNPQNSTNGNSIVSKSMTNLPAKSPPQSYPPQYSSPKLNSGSSGLLFGEIPSGEHDSSYAGFGIDNLPPRRTSESSIVHGLSGRQRSFSELDAEPASPSNWYRDSNASNDATTKTHGRSRSDLASSKPVAPVIRKPVTATLPSSSSNSATVAASRLPVSIRRLNSPTNSSSSSTRSNSPSTFKRQQTNGRSPKTTSPTSRAKTPTQSGRKQPPQSLVTSSSGNSRLQPYNSAAPSALSPPLRSSRPRQPVSVASTASSRMKETTRAKPSMLNNAKNPTLPRPTDSPRRRKISVGPIDFEQRREHIRLAYSKSIRDSQVLEARQRAAEKRKREMEAAAKAKASAVTREIHVDDVVGEDESSNLLPSPDVENINSGIDLEQGVTMQLTLESNVDPPIDESAISPADTLTGLPNSSTTQEPDEKQAIPVIVEDSPTLGVPGSFPKPSPPIGMIERPLSVVSTTSAVTEFDNEPQTEPAIPARTSSVAFNQPFSPRLSTLNHSRAQYQSPFEEDFPSPKELPQGYVPFEEPPKPVPAQARREPVDSGKYYDNDDDEEDEIHGFVNHPQGPYETIIKILPRQQDGLDGTETVPFPRLNPHDESDCHSEFDSVQAMAQSIRQDFDDAATDACTEETDDRDGSEEPQSSYFHRDQVSLHGASTCESSEPETLDELSHPSHRHDRQASASLSNRLLVPPTRASADRSSHHSTWTDLSIESAEHSETPNSPTMQSTTFTSTAYSRQDHTSFGQLPYHDSEILTSNHSARSSGQLMQQLPELDTGDGFSIPYLSPDPNSSFSYLPSPSHEPPPVPSGPNSTINSRTSSVFYEQSHYGSTLLNSEHESVEYMSHVETPQSIDITPNETPDPYLGSQTPVDSDTKSFIQESEELTNEERQRLIQRRNVIKELVDTEAIFVRDMNIVEEIYKGTAEACPKLDAKIIKLIFRNSDEIIEFHTSFLALIKEAVASVYVPKGSRTHMLKDESLYSEPSQASLVDLSDSKDRDTAVGPIFQANIEKMKLAHEGFLRNSDQAAKKLIQIQQDPTVKVWLNECNEVAKDLTAAWDLDSLLIKPMQRITKYPNLIITLLHHTPQDHPDREALIGAKDSLEEAIIEINKTKKNFELVGQIVGRKRKESDVKAGIARAFGKRVDKLQGGNRPPEDPEYAKLEERFSDDYLRLQVVLRDVEFYTRQASSYVHEFLQYLSAIELVMRLQPGSYPELESKWVQFNISIRDLEKVALEKHLAQIRQQVIEPFEHVIKAYGNPSLAMKKRQKRRVVYERAEQLKRAGKSVDPKLKELVEQYEALNDTLIKELPKLSGLTEKVGNICLGNLVNIQVEWYAIWKEKMKAVLSDTPEKPDLEEVVATFQRDFPYANDLLSNISIINPTSWGRASLSTTNSTDESLLRARGRQSEADGRGRGLSVNGESTTPNLPPPDFAKRHSGSFTASPGGSASGSASTSAGVTNVPSPHQYYYRDYYANISNYQPSLTSPRSADMPGGSRSHTGTRPSTGRSFDSSAMPRQSIDSVSQTRRDSSMTYSSSHQVQENRRYSNLFHSALPMTDGPEESQQSSRASSRERPNAPDGYNILWLAASLFEFNISSTKHEAGYRYLTYQAGEIFDVIAEKGELWLAKNQDDPSDQIGWIWSKHFAKLADS